MFYQGTEKVNQQYSLLMSVEPFLLPILVMNAPLSFDHHPSGRLHYLLESGDFLLMVRLGVELVDRKTR